jgi:hypothetical protein
VATGDWTKDLVHLAKTAELKKHALTLQLHTAHILSAHASLEQKDKVIQDLREQKNKLESERTRLLNCLREINEDRDKVDLMESSIEKECQDTRAKIAQLTAGDYAIAKADVDRLRQELGQPPLPSLQSTLDEKTNQWKFPSLLYSLIVDDLLWLDISMNVDWPVMKHKRNRIQSLIHPPRPVRRLPMLVPRVRATNALFLLMKLLMLVRPNDLGVGQRVAKIGWKVIHPEHDCPKDVRLWYDDRDHVLR